MFDTPFFAPTNILLQGAVVGLIFGFLLQKGGVTRFNTIVGQFLLRDYTVLKIMLTAMIFGGAGVYAMLQLGAIEALHVKSAQLLANGLGGVIFGVGMATLGYCPGSAVAAIGDGSRDAIPGVLGMVFGAGVYAEAFPWIKAHILPVGDMGKATLSTTTGLSPWWFVIGLAVLGAAGFYMLERWESRRNAGGPSPIGGGVPRVA